MMKRFVVPGAAPAAAPSSLRVRLFKSYSELPPAAQALFADPSGGDLFQTLPWVANANGLRPGDQLRLHLIVDEAAGDRPLALLPALYSRLYGSHPGARVLHFMQPQEQPYEPLTAADGVPSLPLAQALVGWLSGEGRGHDVLRFSPLEPGSPFAEALLFALRRSRHWVQLYHHALAFHAPVEGLAFKDYLAQRPRPLRELLDLNTRLLMQGGRGRFEYVCTPELLVAAWPRITQVVDQTPVEGEPDPPEYLAAVLQTAAALGALRLGLFHLDERPVAMQLWLVSRGAARLLRLWEAQDRRTFPIDDVLTQMMALCLIDMDHVAELDFGVISEAFAADWAPVARQRIGVAAFNRDTWRGMRGAVRHVGVGLLKNAPRRVWQRVLGLRA